MSDSENTVAHPTTARSMTWAWAALVAVTVGTWWLAPARIAGTVAPNAAITGLVLVMAFIKCRLIFQYFMEIRTAPRWLKVATDAWLGVLTAAAFAIYLV